MARGWESKSVESQIEDGSRDRAPKVKKGDEIIKDTKRRSLEMDRKRVVQEMKSATTPIRKAALESALKYLEDQLSRL